MNVEMSTVAYMLTLPFYMEVYWFLALFPTTTLIKKSTAFLQNVFLVLIAILEANVVKKSRV